MQMQLKTSVRNLVEFLLRSGSIDNRRGAFSDAAMAEGSRIHRMIQRRMGADYQAEVSLKYLCQTSRYDLLIEGRADGIITEAEGFTVDEIKGTYRDISRMTGPVPVHLAQARCYAYMYAQRLQAKRRETGLYPKEKGQKQAEAEQSEYLEHPEHLPAILRNIETIRIRMTYCNLDTEEIRYFHIEESYQELERWFLDLLSQYQVWAEMEFDWKEKRQVSIRALSFPFPYREGQKELAASVYRTICHKRKLFLEAPTGVGKTISTVFPAVKAMGEGKAERLFYLTAKTITRTVAEEAFLLLRKKGLAFKTVLLTAKDKICFLEETACNPEACPYAEGHFDRINDALYDMLTHEVNYSREVLESYAQKHQVCPFEMSLDASLFCDGIICDYNYVFDPHACLRRFFADGAGGDYLFLVDEAHNLVERGREMYSASLWKEEFLELKRQLKTVDQTICRRLDACNRELLTLKRECETYRVIEGIGPFAIALNRLHAVLDAFLEEPEGRGDPAVRESVLDFYFQICHFQDMYELLDDHYVIYTRMEEDGRFLLRLFCVDPGRNLQERLERGVGSILFSATLLPIQYYKKLLGGRPEDYEVYARSAFDPRRCGLFVGRDVTTRYVRRSEEEYRRIARYIYETVKCRHGNYMIFFPSFRFLQSVYEIYRKEFWEEETQECILQEGHMQEREREAFLCRFSGGEADGPDFGAVIRMEVEIEEERSLLGFCVMGGIFSEGIDLKHDRLIGAMIVGTGIPQVCPEREILKQYFDETEGKGFDYAYRYPGMNKVLQSAGRVIRTAEDFGIVALLDERFESPSYRRLFPREWENPESVSVDRIGKRIERFWDEWL